MIQHMLHGYETREELIRDHWKRYGFHWDAGRFPHLKLPIRHKQYPYMALERTEGPPALDLDIALEFSFERGLLNGRPAVRILCEDVIVEESPI